MDFKPASQVQVARHPPAPGVQHDNTKIQSLSFEQIAFNELFPLEPSIFGDPSVSVSWKVGEMILAADSVKVYCLRATGLVAGESQPFLPRQGINETGLANVTTS